MTMTSRPPLETKSNTLDALTDGKLLARNTVLNLFGQCSPLLVAIFAIPPLIKGLGTDRFGVLTLAWIIVGYFSLFDLGLGRALTQQVAEKLGAEQEQEIPPLFWTALFLMLLLGLLGALTVSLLAKWLVEQALKIPQGLQRETLVAFYLLAFSIPIVITSAGLRSILDAQQRFDLINLVRIPMGILTFLGPLSVLPFSRSLVPIVAVLAMVRVMGWIVHLVCCFHVMPTLRLGIVLQRRKMVPLFRFGIWLTVSNIISPLMVYLDRFLIAAFLSVTFVAYYATPYEVVTKLSLIPESLVGVLFPAFSATFNTNRRHTELVFSRGLKYVFILMFIPTLIILTFAPEAIYLWLGAEFAENSTLVLKWLAVGVFINSLARVALALVHGAGRPDLSAKLYLIELPFYLLAVVWLIKAYGIEGAAIAWVARVTIDTILLFAMAQRLLRASLSIIGRRVLAMVSTLLIMALATIPVDLYTKSIFLLISLLAFSFAAWFLILSHEERTLLASKLKTIHLVN